jgi:hypothetical protein
LRSVLTQAALEETSADPLGRRRRLANVDEFY